MPATVPAAEEVDVLVIGAGLSGIAAAHHLQAECPWATYTIVEARQDIGGTWDLFRFPGIRSDSDMYTLGYPFRPWTAPEAIADGEAIRAYIKETAAQDGSDAKIRFGHRVVRADWSTPDARWHVAVERTDTGETVEFSCGFILSCTGYYRYDHGYQPDFPGLARYTGTVVHPQLWPEDLDYAGKEVLVIGSGATAVTLVPSMAETAGHVTMLQRSPSYVASLPQRDPVAQLLGRVLPKRYAGGAVRWFKALTTQAFWRVSRRYPDAVRRLLTNMARRQLPPGYDVDPHFTPRYNPWDQRVCAVPDGDLFKAISAGRVSVVTDRIDTFTERGVLLESGTELTADIVVTATGLELLFLGGIDLVVDGDKVDVATKMTYKGMMLEGVPNLAVAFGYTNASWTLKCDLTCGYACRLLNHLRDSGMRQCTPVNRDPSIVALPMMTLTSGYVQRAAGRLPQQGSAFPWQVHQSYLRDYRALRRSGLEDTAMVFSNPARDLTAAGVAAGTGGA